MGDGSKLVLELDLKRVTHSSDGVVQRIAPHDALRRVRLWRRGDDVKRAAIDLLALLKDGELILAAERRLPLASVSAVACR